MIKNPVNLIPSDEVVAERHSRYGQHLPTHPLRQTRVPVVLAEHPKFRALAAERQAVVDAELRLSTAHADLTSRNELTRAEHRDAQRRAVLTGENPPAALELEPWPFPEHTRPLFDRLHQVIEAAELGTLAENAGRWAADLDTRSAPMRQALDEARRTAARLEADLAVYDQARAVLARLPGADPSTGPDQHAEHVEDVERRMARPTEEERAAQAQIVADFEQVTRPTRRARR